MDKQEGYKDTVRYYVLPWLIVATVDSYKYASFRERIQSLVFVDKLLTNLETFARQMSAEKRPWIAAEYLISLGYLAGEAVL